MYELLELLSVLILFLAMGWWPCGGCDAEDECGCVTGTQPSTWTCVFTGIEDGDCADCANMNGTHTTGLVTACSGVTNSDQINCTGGAVTPTLSVALLDNAGQTELQVTWGFNSGFGQGQIRFKVALSGNDCDVTDLDVPHLDTTGTNCGTTAPQCTITANA